MYSGVVAGRASIVGAAATHVGKVREHNEDAHYIDVDLGLFLVCDGMGGHAAGEVASATAIRAIASHIRRIRPHVIVTFGPDGAYGNPDHIAVSQFATAAAFFRKSLSTPSAKPAWETNVSEVVAVAPPKDPNIGR